MFLAYVLLCRMMTRFVSETGGEPSLLWKPIFSISVFTIIPISMILAQRFRKFEIGPTVIFIDFVYSYIGFGLFVFYVNNILLNMG